MKSSLLARFSMIIYLFMCIHFKDAAAEGFNDSTFDKSLLTTQHIWHSYTFNTKAGNREELYFSNVEHNNNFEFASSVFMWKSLQTDKEVVIVGLGNNFLKITTVNGKNNTFTHKQVLEIQGSAKALTIFQKWDVKAQEMKNLVIVATCSTEEKYHLLWYYLFNGKLKFLWDWQYHGNVTHMDVIKINYDSKLLVVNQNNSTHKKPSAEIYSFNFNYGLDIWLSEKIILDGSPSSVTVFDSSDNVFLCASFPSLETVHIFKYSKLPCLNTLEKKRFVSHQKIFSIGLKSITSFRVGFRWHLAVASSSSLVYYLEENLFQPVSTFPLGDFDSWLAVPVDTYREDTILLASSKSDLSVVTWMGDGDLRIVGSFTRFACGDDFECSEKMKTVSLSESTVFTFNGHQNIIISTKNKTALFFKVLIKLKPLPDKSLLKLQEILKEKNFLEENYINQNEQINELLSEEESSKIDSIVFSKSKKQLEMSPQTKTEKEISNDVTKLKSTAESLEVDIEMVVAKLEMGFSEKGGPDSKAFLSRNITDGITFYGDVQIGELDLSSINGYSVNKLFSDIFKKSKAKKIGGKKTLKKLSVENVMFEKFGNTYACDIVFSDDPWESQNIINGDLIFENKLTVLNDVNLLREGIKSDSLSKLPRGILKPNYEELNFEELEVSEDLHVQGNINGQPIILPVHGDHLNVMDIVSHARFEVVNVKQNLNVEFINGENFTSLAEKILRKDSRLELDSLIIDGMFSAVNIEADEINNIDLQSPKLREQSDAVGRSEKILANDPDPDSEEIDLKRSSIEQLKRIIHVFENIEIDGILFSNKINNISWAVFNDTVRKNEETVNLFGVKTFQKSLKVKKAVLRGTLNGRFVENVMTNFSDQTIRYPQIFNVAKFQNLFVEGYWDGVSLNELNNTIVRLSANNGKQSNLTFEDDCFINVLNVENSVNGVNLYNKTYKSHNGKIEFKSIKASHLILHGSLITNSKINNMNLTNFNMLRVSLKSPEVVDQDIYHYNVTVSGDLNVETLNFNDVSSIINSGGDTKLIGNFMNGNVQKIKKLLVKGNITTSHGINGVILPRIFEKGIEITKPRYVKGNVIFENILYFDNINVTNTIDGFSLKHLEKDIAFKHSHVYLTGPKNFSTLKVTKSMRARTLNGHLMQDIVTLKGDHTMKGQIRINGNVVVRGNITSYSAVNNITVPDLLKTYSTRFNSFIYSGDLNLTSEEVTVKNLKVFGRIQNVSLDALIRDSVRKDDGVNGFFNVSGKKIFKGKVKFKENVSVKGLIHGVNFTTLYSDITFINKPTTLRGTVTIQESVLKDLETTGHFNATLINNVDTNDWLEDSIPLDRFEIISGKKVFENAHSLADISVDFINGHLPSEMITLKKKQHIPVLALFPRIQSLSDISVDGLVNGMNLLDEFRDCVLLNGPQQIIGETIFDAEFVVNGTLSVDTIKGKKVNSLVTLDTEQTIKTPLQFKGLVTAKKDVKSLKVINNISLSDWNERSVLLNKNQVLTGLWTVKGKFKAKNIEGEGTLHSVSLPKVSEKVQKSTLKALEIKNETEAEYLAQCHKVEQFTQQFSRLPYLLDKFETVCEVETHSVVESVITFKVNNADSLLVTFVNECLSSLYYWNKETATFDYKRQINIGPVNKWLAIQRDDATYLITSSPSDRTCEERLQRGNVWVFKADDIGYAHLVTTNAFADITQKDKTSGEFFTIDGNGILQQWTLLENGNVTVKILNTFSPDNYKFIDFKIMGELSVSNGKEIKKISLEDGNVSQRHFPLPNAYLVALPVDGKLLTAAVAKDKIVIYENIFEKKIYFVLHTYKAGSVLWFDYGLEKQAFLIVSSHHKLIEVYEYKSVSGLVKKMSIQMYSSRLQSVMLPVKEKYQSENFVIVIQKKKLSFLRAEMFGDHFEKSDSLC